MAAHSTQRGLFVVPGYRRAAVAGEPQRQVTWGMVWGPSELGQP